MSGTERRRLARGPLRATCMVQFAGGSTVYGTVKDFSLDGVFIECMLPRNRTGAALTLGEFGMFVLRYRDGAQDESLRLRAQLVHLLPNGMGLRIQFAELNKREQRTLTRIVESGNTELAPEQG